MKGRNARSVAVVLAAAVAFGAAMSVLKGNGSGVRDAVGNVSAPWLVLPFAAGAILGRRSLGLGAVVGLLTSIAALAGFYVANSLVLDLGPHSWLVDLRLALRGGRFYFALGALSGPVFGALGAVWRRRRSTALGVLVALLLVAEPFAWLAYERGQPAGYASNVVVWIVEMVLGLIAAALVASTARSRRDVGVSGPSRGDAGGPITS